MRITCTSDLHGYYPEDLEGGDILIVAGDLTANDTEFQHEAFRRWLDRQEYDAKIFIGGNHDGWLEAGGDKRMPPLKGTCYLEDDGIEIQGIKIWGSPWTPRFFDWHFMRERGEEIRKHWDLIPDDVDILVTHGPPHSILDRNLDGRHVGCVDLLAAVKRVKPQFHVFGHIHEAYGRRMLPGTTFMNVAHCNRQYLPVNSPMTITWVKAEDVLDEARRSNQTGQVSHQ